PGRGAQRAAGHSGHGRDGPPTPDPDDREPGAQEVSPVDRRNFLKGSLATLGAAGAGAGAATALHADHARAAATADLTTASRELGARELAQRVTFDGTYQSGILTPRPAQATFVALDSVAASTTALFEGLQAISTQARLLSQGEPVAVAEIDQPPP